MHPAPSVILFSTLSGAGFGILAMIGIWQTELFGGAAFAAYFLGYALAVGGLMLSAFHLANKKNAIKAFRQWRSSWLSREAVFAVAALVVIAPEAIARIFFSESVFIFAIIGAVLCYVTVFSTAMIYAQLKTVPRWNTWLTPVIFLGYAICAPVILDQFGMVIFMVLLIQALFQILHWLHGDKAISNRNLSIERATGLTKNGRVRLLEPPHSGENYLLKEMGYQIGRKHAYKLRILTLIFAFLLPILMVFFMDNLSTFMRVLILFIHLLGVLASRWLFFAEAKHVQAFYYDR